MNQVGVNREKGFRGGFAPPCCFGSEIEIPGTIRPLLPNRPVSHPSHDSPNRRRCWDCIGSSGCLGPLWKFDPLIQPLCSTLFLETEKGEGGI